MTATAVANCFCAILIMYVLMISELLCCVSTLDIRFTRLSSLALWEPSIAIIWHHLTSKTISTNLVLRPSHRPVLAAYRGGRLGTVYHTSNIYLGKVDREGVGRGGTTSFTWGYATRRTCTTCQCLSFLLACRNIQLHIINICLHILYIGICRSVTTSISGDQC